MKLPNPYKCDECGALKQDVNHWWLLLLGYRLFPNWPPILDSSFLLIRWDVDIADRDGVVHLCSQKCAIARLDKWMSEKAQIPTEAT